MGWHESPLILFTVIAQSAVGGFWWCAWAFYRAGLSPEQRQRLEQNMLALWVMMGAALAFSSFHLGSPWRGVNAILRFGSSSLSNEVVFGSLFFGLGALNWLLCRRNLSTADTRKYVFLATLACSVLFLWNMCAFYLMPTVPTWNTPLTPSAFLLTTILGGSAVASVLFSRSEISQSRLLSNGPMLLSVVAVVAALIVTLLQAGSLPEIHSSIKQASALSPDYAGLMTTRFVMLFVAMGLWLRQYSRGEVLSVSTGGLCIALILVGEMIGRGVFYGLHMTVGLV